MYTQQTLCRPSPRGSPRTSAELEAYLDEERLDRSTAVRKLLLEGLEAWQQDRALERFADGDVPYINATELADLSVWEFARLVEDTDAAWVSSDHLEADLDEL